MKEYQLIMNRIYTTEITLRFPDDGADHKEKINECIELGDQGIWDLIAEKELEQMNVDDITWEIQEINTTRTGALSPFTGPRDTNNKKDMNKDLEMSAEKLTTLIRDELAESQVNKENNSAEYRLGKNEAYSKVLSVITTELKIIEKWGQDH
jgi:hypothetical protein